MAVGVNFDSATGQWNDETRSELRERLRKELNEFKEAKQIHELVINNAYKD